MGKATKEENVAKGAAEKGARVDERGGDGGGGGEW